MGYENRLYIVEKYRHSDYAEIIARYDCSEMWSKNECEKLFDKPFKGTIYMDDGDEPIKEDWYGDSLKYAEFPDVIEWLENEIKKNDYRRLSPLLSLLKGFDLSKWGDGEMQIVHFGY